VPGDYDGDGKTDFAVIREGSEWTWFVLQSSNDTFFAVQFGARGQFSAQSDYDGDGRTDVAAYDPFTGAFYYLRSSDGALTARAFGRNGDFPIAVYNSF
jgi:spore coat protein A, manganese oxidase